MKGTDEVINHPDWVSLRSLDLAAGLPKGSAFRAFKQLADELIEGQDFRVLHHQHDATEIAQLRQTQGIYSNSVNVLLLSPAAAQRVATALRPPQ